MPDSSPILSLPLLLPAQAQKHVTHNEALLLLDALTQLVVEEAGAVQPPADPLAGARYLVGAGAIGAWAGQDEMLALFDGAAWRFLSPRAGWSAEVPSENRRMVFDGTHWTEAAPDMNNLDGVGVGASFDTVNRLSVVADATLLSHAGAGHQLKLNKSGVGDTASLLFQTGWSGRAEMGLSGSDAFSIKLSVDGTTWSEVLTLDPVTGAASGAAIQSGPADVTPGRLMRADYGYGPGNILGAVSQSGGVPTGAVIEQGGNANGHYLRLADGTQICRFKLNMGLITYSGAGSFDDPYRTDDVDWTFPLPFATPPEVTSMAAVDTPGARRNAVFLAFGGATETATYGLRGYRVSGSNEADVVMANLCAVGRWF